MKCMFKIRRQKRGAITAINRTFKKWSSYLASKDSPPRVWFGFSLLWF